MVYLPPSAVIRNNDHAFEVKHMLAIDADAQELRFTSQIKKLGSNPNSSKIKMKIFLCGRHSVAHVLSINTCALFSTWKESKVESLGEFQGSLIPMRFAPFS